MAIKFLLFVLWSGFCLGVGRIKNRKKLATIQAQLEGLRTEAYKEASAFGVHVRAELGKVKF